MDRSSKVPQPLGDFGSDMNSQAIFPKVSIHSEAIVIAHEGQQELFANSRIHLNN